MFAGRWTVDLDLYVIPTGFGAYRKILFLRYIVPDGTLEHRFVDLYRYAVPDGTILYHGLFFLRRMVKFFFYRHIVPSGTLLDSGFFFLHVVITDGSLISSFRITICCLVDRALLDH